MPIVRGGTGDHVTLSSQAFLADAESVARVGIRVVPFAILIPHIRKILVPEIVRLARIPVYVRRITRAATPPPFPVLVGVCECEWHRSAHIARKPGEKGVLSGILDAW